MRPPAVMRLLPDGSAVVCAWCDSKGSADTWARENGYNPTHGICPTCKARQTTRDVSAGSLPAGFVTARELEEICGLPGEELWGKFRPARWQAGTEFLTGQEDYGFAFREAFLGELVGELAVSGRREAAVRLLSWLTRDARPDCLPPQRVAPPSPRRVSWMKQWEERDA